MRKITKDFDDIPAILLSQSCQDLITLSLTQKGAHEFKTQVYGHPEIKRRLNRIYHNKCCFCETNTAAGAPLQVEHYRPKAVVFEVAGHPGYYWLGYQWSNLLLACSACNNKKRNRFPATGVRVATPPLNAAGTSLDVLRCKITAPEIVAERAQIVNPEMDPSPMRHFRFQADGTIEYKTPEGEATLKVCNLNREALMMARKKLYDRFFNRMLEDMGEFGQGVIDAAQLHERLFVIIRDLIKHIIDDTNEYLEFAKTCWNEFENFFLAKFQPAEQAYLRAAYTKLKNMYDAA